MPFGTPPIQDDLTDNVLLTRQEKYQLRNARKGCCRLCSEPAVPGMRVCAMHRATQNKLAREARARQKKAIDLDVI